MNHSTFESITRDNNAKSFCHISSDSCESSAKLWPDKGAGGHLALVGARPLCMVWSRLLLSSATLTLHGWCLSIASNLSDMVVHIALMLKVAAELLCSIDPVTLKVMNSALPDGAPIRIHMQHSFCFADGYLQRLHRTERWSLRVLSGSRVWLAHRVHFVPPAVFVVIGKALWVRDTLLHYPELESEWNSSALFLGILPRSATEAEVRTLLWDTWTSLSLADLTVLVSAGHANWTAHAAFPFADATGQCGRVVNAHATFRTWSLVSGEAMDRFTVFPVKEPADLDGCFLAVNLQYDPNIFSPGYLIPEGYAMAMLNALLKYLNVRPLRITAPTDQFDTTPGAPDWSWYDALSGLDSGQVDLLVGQYSFTAERHDLYSSLGPFGSTYYRWYLPLPQPSFLPVAPHLAMPLPVVVLMLLMLVTTVLVMSAAGGHDPLIIVWAMFVEQPVNTAGVMRPSLLALVLTALLGFLNVNVFIKSSIVYSMSSPQLNEALRTPADLLALDRVVVGVESPFMQDLLENSEDLTFRLLSNHTQECYINYTSCVDRVQSYSGQETSNGGEFYCMLCSDELISFTTGGQVGSIMYPLSEALHRNVYGWYARKWFPLRDRANNLILLLQQSGLLPLWTQTLSNNLSAVQSLSRRRRKCQNGEACSISFARARNLFIMLSLGLMVAATVLLAELAVHKASVRTTMRSNRKTLKGTIPAFPGIVRRESKCA
ncbi:uncharacterized protein LOC127750886 [Frankliniella occidentalis]|uniref:Uncharacterized protein LOC127750886 n=1 Tax=Frankliniella occidentalis TaxID=133901 RepID=A0A9C6XSJ0_FRAOC|nr:uncharacterized protein LOC127750886 [Frankliniella occidentalis]